MDGAFESTGLPGVEASEAQGAESGGRSWWMWEDTGSSARPSLAATYTGWEASRDLLIDQVSRGRGVGLGGGVCGSGGAIGAGQPSEQDL